MPPKVNEGSDAREREITKAWMLAVMVSMRRTVIETEVGTPEHDRACEQMDKAYQIAKQYV